MVKGLLLISPTGSSNLQRGFTLLELMIVVMVVSIMSSIVAMTIPSGRVQQEVEKQALNVRLFLRQVHQKAVYDSLDIGVHIGADQLTLLQYQDNRWTVLNNSPHFTLDPTYEWSLSVENQQISIQTSYLLVQDLPHLVFFSDGQYTDFMIDISKQGNIYSIEGLFNHKAN